MGAFDPELQRRLRADRPSVMAVTFTVLAGVAALLAMIDVVPATFQQNRASPFYWIVVLAFVWWGSSVLTFGQRWLATVRPALLLAPMVAGLSLAYICFMGRPALLHGIAFGTTILFAALGLRSFRKSFLNNGYLRS